MKSHTFRTNWLTRQRRSTARIASAVGCVVERLESRMLMSYSVVVTTHGDGTSAVTSEGGGEYTTHYLRSAIYFANTKFEANSAASTAISFTPDLTGTILLNNSDGGELQIEANNTSIDGSGADITVSGNGTSTVFLIEPDATASISHLTITDGNALAYSGTGLGGGIDNKGGTLTLTNCTVSGDGIDSGANYGGGIYSSGTLIMTGCTVTGDGALKGGGIFSSDLLKVYGSLFSTNYSIFDGGAINGDGPTLVQGCQFADNHGDTGGAIAIYGGTDIITESTFAYNYSTGQRVPFDLDGGGAIAVEDSSASAYVYSSGFSRNESKGDGGAVLNYGGTIAIANSAFSYGSAYSNGSTSFSSLGGGLYALGGTTTIVGSTFNNNSSYGGGAIACVDGDLTLLNSTVANNSALMGEESVVGGGDEYPGGGGIMAYDSNAVIVASTIADNKATTSEGNPGGGILVGSYSTVKLYDTIVAANINGDGPSSSDIYGSSVNSASAYNLIGTGGSGGLDSNNDNIILTGSETAGLGSLGDNGGPTQTIALLSNSPAIDAGSVTLATDFSLTTDQRGEPRFSATLSGMQSVDIGAYQFMPAIYVDATVSGGDDNGTSWANAFASLQDALAANSGPAIFFIAYGTYAPTSTSTGFVLQSSTELVGGFVGSGETPYAQSASPTILSGVGAYHVLYADGVSTIVLSDLTISGGDADGSTDIEKNGGGIYIYESDSIDINNCIFVNDQAEHYGGAVYDNIAFNALNCTNCFFLNDSANDGGAIASFSAVGVNLINCTFEGDIATDNGGGLDSEFYTYITITNCVFEGDGATDGKGGAVFDNDIDEEVRITNSTFYDNHANSSGGAIFNSNNPARYYQTLIANSILWGDGPNEIGYTSGSEPTVEYSDIDQSGYAGSDGNIDSNPDFVSAGDRDFQLYSDSPAINAGNNSYTYDATVPHGEITTDMAGNARNVDGTVDMGAYEYQGEDVTTPEVMSMSPSYTDTLVSSLAITLNTGSATATFEVINATTGQTATFMTSQIGDTYTLTFSESLSAGNYFVIVDAALSGVSSGPTVFTVASG
jgi:predicted outer membrane repeat protein